MFQQAKFGIDPNNGKNAPKKKKFFYAARYYQLKIGHRAVAIFPESKLER